MEDTAVGFSDKLETYSLPAVLREDILDPHSSREDPNSDHGLSAIFSEDVPKPYSRCEDPNSDYGLPAVPESSSHWEGTKNHSFVIRDPLESPAVDIPDNLVAYLRPEDANSDPYWIQENDSYSGMDHSSEDRLGDFIRGDVCIYKVPSPIRSVRKEAYSPQVVSIGLLHMHNRTRRMEWRKKGYLGEFLKRLKTNFSPDVFIGQLETEISSQLEFIINCYEESYNISRQRKDELVKVILLDAVFIMELFLRNCKPQNYKNDTIIWRPLFRAAVQQDLLLFENQLPFKVLDQLFKHSLSNFNIEGEVYYEFSFLELTCKYFSTCGPRGRVITNLQGANFLHFTDVVRHIWLIDLPGNQTQPGNQSQVSPQIKIYIPSATNLHEQAGVEFELSKNTKLPKVIFKEKKYLIWKVGKLIMSKIIINSITEVIIRNIMILEIYYYPRKTYVCNYITLLDYLINTVEDVNLLVGAKIITNHLGDNALIVEMINKLCNRIDEGDNCYYQLFQQLDQFYQRKDIRRMATLERVYFKDAWTSTATIFGVFVIILQFVQTFSSIWQITYGNK